MSVNRGSQELYQQLLTCLRGTWQSIAVVPAGPDQSAAVVANAMVEVSALVRGQKARLFNSERLSMAAVASLISEVTQHVDAGGLAIVVLESVVAKQAGIPITAAADAALLVVHLGVSKISDAQQTVELIGESKFVGSVIIEPS